MNGTILIVDDDELFTEYVSGIIMATGKYNIFKTHEASTAEKKIKEINPDLILMDWEMPIINGIDLIKKVKSNPQLQTIPIILITGKPINNEDIQTAFNAGASDYIRKPVEQTELLARINHIITAHHYQKTLLQQKNQELIHHSKINYRNENYINDLVTTLSEALDEIKNYDQTLFESIQSKIKSIENNFKNRSWEQLHEHFKEVHPDFSSKLIKKYPTLTPEEIKLCHFLKMNMSSKEIAALTNKEAHSVDVSRYRLRKKLQLESKQKISEILSEL